MTSQPPPDPPSRPSINQAARRYRGDTPARNVTPGPRPSTPAASRTPAGPAPAPAPAPPGAPCPDRSRHDRRLRLMHRLRYAAITLALMVATGAAVALYCMHR